MTTPNKTTRRTSDSGKKKSEKGTTRCVSRSKHGPEKAPKSPARQITTPQKVSEKSTLARKFAATVMQPTFEQMQQQLKKTPSEVEALLRLEKNWRNLDRFESDTPLYLIKTAITLIARDPEMSNFFLKDAFGHSTQKEREKAMESYGQKSPLGELLYTRWIEGLRERWPAI